MQIVININNVLRNIKPPPPTTIITNKHFPHALVRMNLSECSLIRKKRSRKLFVGVFVLGTVAEKSVLVVAA